MNCPQCDKPMTKKARGDVTLDACRQCRGLWFDSGEVDDLKDQVAPPELSWTDFELWRRKAEFEVASDPLQCPRCPDIALKVMTDKETDTSVRFCPRCKGSWMTAGDFAGIVSALNTEVDHRTTADYFRESLKQAAELIASRENPISEWKDFKAVLRLLKVRFFVENPKFASVVKGFQKSLPL
ncbi:MAG: zf-TFIIB domain-containing protein [Desulfobacterales bacterium]|jgi:Zn-finger nucleic acid-binding protein